MAVECRATIRIQCWKAVVCQSALTLNNIDAIDKIADKKEQCILEQISLAQAPFTDSRTLPTVNLADQPRAKISLKHHPLSFAMRHSSLQWLAN